MAPTFKSSNDNVWQRVTSNIAATMENNETGLEITWTHRFVNPEETVWFSFTFPFSIEDSENLLRDYEQKIISDKNMYMHRCCLIRSKENRSIELVTISSTKNQTNNLEKAIHNIFTDGKRPHIFSSKKVVFLSARVHPGETPASHVLNGVLDVLLNQSKDPRSQSLLDNFVFYIIPFINPDGVFRGHYRTDTSGQNLNRFYITPSLNEHPSVYAIKELILHLNETKRLHCYIDLHAHATKKGCFVYGNCLDLKDQLETCLFPRLMSLNSPYFEYESCNFTEKNMYSRDRGDGLSKEGAGRVALYKATKLNLCYTLECNYNSGTLTNKMFNVGKDSQQQQALDTFGYDQDVILNGVDMQPLVKNTEPYTLETFRSIGESICDALLDYSSLHPYSRLNNSPYKNIANMKMRMAYNLLRIIPFRFCQYLRKLLRFIAIGDNMERTLKCLWIYLQTGIKNDVQDITKPLQMKIPQEKGSMIRNNNSINRQQTTTVTTTPTMQQQQQNQQKQSLNQQLEMSFIGVNNNNNNNDLSTQPNLPSRKRSAISQEKRVSSLQRAQKIQQQQYTREYLPSEENEQANRDKDYQIQSKQLKQLDSYGYQQSVISDRLRPVSSTLDVCKKRSKNSERRDNINKYGEFFQDYYDSNDMRQERKEEEDDNDRDNGSQGGRDVGSDNDDEGEAGQLEIEGAAEKEEQIKILKQQQRLLKYQQEQKEEEEQQQQQQVEEEEKYQMQLRQQLRAQQGQKDQYQLKPSDKDEQLEKKIQKTKDMLMKKEKKKRNSRKEEYNTTNNNNNNKVVSIKQIDIGITGLDDIKKQPTKKSSVTFGRNNNNNILGRQIISQQDKQKDGLITQKELVQQQQNQIQYITQQQDGSPQYLGTQNNYENASFSLSQIYNESQQQQVVQEIKSPFRLSMLRKVEPNLAIVNSFKQDTVQLSQGQRNKPYYFLQPQQIYQLLPMQPNQGIVKQSRIIIDIAGKNNKQRSDSQKVILARSKSRAGTRLQPAKTKKQ